jgi:hypothetical protein
MRFASLVLLAATLFVTSGAFGQGLYNLLFSPKRTQADRGVKAKFWDIRQWLRSSPSLEHGLKWIYGLN